MSARRRVYGPVPSRRLGRSLGVDIVPFKVCPYDCVYCQLGRTTERTDLRREFTPLDEILAELELRLAAGPAPDYISLSGSGEPTLYSRAGELLRGIKKLTAVPTAVLTNGALLWRDDVREDLQAADLVLPSLDAGDESLFKYVNRPCREISFDRMVAGLEAFNRDFRGEVWLEVMLLGGVTGLPEEARKIAALCRRIAPGRVQLNTVTRPPAEDFAFPVPPEEMRSLARLFPGTVEIISPAGPGPAAAAEARRPEEEEILELVRRRPCTAADVAGGLGLHLTEALKALDAMRARGLVKTTPSAGRTFYVPGGGA
jgi:wyosine [tRNA(Phe)-imidazoG37] synthetase (radical SAM superfamily)